MSPEREDWQELADRKKVTQGAQDEQRAKEMVALGNKALDLVGDPCWDWYVVELQKVRNDAEGIAETHRERLTSIEVVNSDEIMRLKLIIVGAECRAGLAREFLNLVKETIERGQKVQEGGEKEKDLSA